MIQQLFKAMTVGRVTYENPYEILVADIDLEILNMILLLIKDTGSTGNKILDFINEGGLAQKLANFNLSKTLSDLVFTQAGAADSNTKEMFKIKVLTLLII
jgi:hypothetical protein